MASKTGIDVQVLNKSIVQTGAQAIAVRESTLFLPIGGDAEAICNISGEYKTKRGDLKAKSKIFKKESVHSITLKFLKPLVCVYHIVMEKFEEKTKERWFENLGRTFMDMMKKADKKGMTSIACSLLGSGQKNEYESDSIDAILRAIVNVRNIKNLQTVYIVTSNKNHEETIRHRHSILLQTQTAPGANFLNRGAGIWITNLFQRLFAAKNRNKDDGLFRKRSLSVGDLSKRTDLKRNSSRRLKKNQYYHSDEDIGTGDESPDATTLKRPFAQDLPQSSSDFPKAPIKDEPDNTEKTVNMQDQTHLKSNPLEIAGNPTKKSETLVSQPAQRKEVKRYLPHLPSIKSKISLFETKANPCHDGTSKGSEDMMKKQAIKISVEESRFDEVSVASAEMFGPVTTIINNQSDKTGDVAIASKGPSKLNRSHLDFSQLPTLTGKKTRCFKTKRDDVVEPLLNVYRDQEIVNGGIKVVFEDEIENDADLTVELFTTFWNEVMHRYWKGEDATVPSMSLGRSRKEQWKYESMGRILSHTVALTSNLPCRISRSALCCILLEKEPEEKTLLSDLILYVTLAERKVLEKALMDLNSLENSESEQLVDFFSHYEMGELPKRTEIREQILETAKQILIMAPERFYKLIRKGIPKEHHSFWKQITVQQISQYIEDKRPTASKVMAKLKTTSGHLKLPEQSVFYFLRQFVDSLDQDGISQFLLYVTGSIHLPVMPIHVSFNNLVEEHRLPKAHTCNNTLKLSPSYNNVQEFRREFMQVLNSSYSFQYTLKE